MFEYLEIYSKYILDYLMFAGLPQGDTVYATVRKQH